MPRSISPVTPEGVTNANDFQRKFELIETRWKLSDDDSSNTASTVPAEPQSSVSERVFLFAGSAPAGPAATARSTNAVSATLRAKTTRLISTSWKLRDNNLRSTPPAQVHRLNAGPGERDAAGAMTRGDGVGSERRSTRVRRGPVA